MRVVHRCEVYGVEVDEATRCAHWHSPLDIIAIRFRCCGLWYPCFECHSEIADHSAEVWPRSEFGEKAVLCGACVVQLPIHGYLACENSCPSCTAEFNPGCANHYHLYFEAD